jgi:hypothetical protein
MSAIDAVDGSFTGTQVPWMWVLLKHPRIRQIRAQRAMASRHQPDLLETQSELFDEEAETPVYRPDTESVRARLQVILAETKTAHALPWERLRLYRTIFPQMTLWLPEDEGA